MKPWAALGQGGGGGPLGVGLKRKETRNLVPCGLWTAPIPQKSWAPEFFILFIESLAGEGGSDFWADPSGGGEGHSGRPRFSPEAALRTPERSECEGRWTPGQRHAEAAPAGDGLDAALGRGDDIPPARRVLSEVGKGGGCGSGPPRPPPGGKTRRKRLKKIQSPTSAQRWVLR